jgi:hypothetical protein
VGCGVSVGPGMGVLVGGETCVGGGVGIAVGGTGDFEITVGGGVFVGGVPLVDVGGEVGNSPLVGVGGEVGNTPSVGVTSGAIAEGTAVEVGVVSSFAPSVLCRSAISPSAGGGAIGLVGVTADACGLAPTFAATPVARAGAPVGRSGPAVPSGGTAVTPSAAATAFSASANG